MKELYTQLLELTKTLPVNNSITEAKRLSGILDKYKTILETVNQSSEELKRQTNLYYTEISRIENDINNSIVAKSKRQRDIAFYDAVKGLRSDMTALSRLIKVPENS